MKFPKKVLHFITNSCHHPYIYALAEFTDRSKFEILVGTLNSRGDLHENLEKAGIKTFALDVNKRSQFPTAIYKLARILKEKRIDIIQTHLFDASLVGLSAAKLARTPLKILTGHHSHEMPFYQGKISFKIDSFTSRFLADYIIAPSEQMKEIFVETEKVPQKKIAVVHHGFNFSGWKFSTEGRERVRTEFSLENKIVFGAVGKIFWIKDYPTLIKAFAPVAKENKDAVLMIVGNGDQTDLRKLAKKFSIDNQIIFTGWRDDVADLLSAIDVFVHPSLAESFGLVIIEAMAMRNPVICTDVGIAREIIKDNDNGFLVPTRNASELANAMKKVIRQQDKWDQMGKVNAIKAQEFTASKMAEGYQEHYIKWLRYKND